MDFHQYSERKVYAVRTMHQNVKRAVHIVCSVHILDTYRFDLVANEMGLVFRWDNQRIDCIYMLMKSLIYGFIPIKWVRVHIDCEAVREANPIYVFVFIIRI